MSTSSCQPLVEKELILGPEQEICKVSLQYHIVPDRKEVNPLPNSETNKILPVLVGVHKGSNQEVPNKQS